jgi:hypothetical protein
MMMTSRFEMTTPSNPPRRRAVRRSLSRSALAGAAAASVATLILPIAALAAYPPGPFPGAAPGGAFSTIVTSAIVCADGGSLQGQTANGNVTADIPALAFAECTQVTIYAGNRAVIGPTLPAGLALADAVAVGWQSTSNAASAETNTAKVAVGSAVKLTIDDPTITTAAKAYRTTSTGIEAFAGASIANGHVTFNLVDPTGVAVATPRAGPVAGTTPPPTDADVPTTRPVDSSPLGAWVLLVAGLAAAILGPRRPTRRRSRS